MSFEVKPATRSAVKPIICFYSESGCGKTYSALLLARGFVGPKGKIIMCDSESGRGSLYADVIPGGYDTIQIGAPFSPARAIEVITLCEKSGAQIGILDSASHFWEGIGGVLDMATQNEEKSGKPGLHNWRMPKMEHAKFVLKLLQSSIPWIICLRAKYKTKQAKNNGKTEIVKDDYTTPIQADDFIFETTCHGEILPNHHFRLTKCSHPELRRCLPNNEPVTSDHGKLVAQWCASPGSSPSTPTATNGTAELKKRLWNLTKPIHGGEQGKLLQFLIDELILEPHQTLADLSSEELEACITKAKAKMEQIVQQEAAQPQGQLV